MVKILSEYRLSCTRTGQKRGCKGGFFIMTELKAIRMTPSSARRVEMFIAYWDE